MSIGVINIDAFYFADRKEYGIMKVKVGML